jgi:hypothetical protein
MTGGAEKSWVACFVTTNVSLATRKVVRPVDSVRWLAIAAACIPGIPALILVVMALSTQRLEDWEIGLIPLPILFALAPLVAYGLWILSRHQGGKLSFGTSLLVAGLTVFGTFLTSPVFIIGLAFAPLARDPAGTLFMGIGLLVWIATGAANFFLFLLLITNRR